MNITHKKKMFFFFKSRNAEHFLQWEGLGVGLVQEDIRYSLNSIKIIKSMEGP